MPGVLITGMAVRVGTGTKGGQGMKLLWVLWRKAELGKEMGIAHV